MTSRQPLRWNDGARLPAARLCQHGGDELAGAVEHVLAVVDHQQYLFGAEEVDHPLQRRPARLIREAQRGGDCGRHPAAVGELGELADMDAVAVTTPRSG